MDSLHGFTVFTRVAETRSFVAAARQLGVSASAVSKNIARLEDRLGVRLFHRSTRSITLTAEGVVFLERCRRILAEIEAAEAEFSARSASPRGRLRISLPMVGPLLWPLLGVFNQHYPGIELELDFTNRMVDVIEEGFDVVIRSGRPRDSRLTVRHLGAFQSILVASPGYLAQRGTPDSLKELEGHACLRYRFPNSGKLESWALPAGAPRDKVEVPITLVCNNIETLSRFAVQGLGIAFLPTFTVQEQLAQGTLVHVLEKHAAWTVSLNLLWPASKHASNKVQALVEFLTERLGDARGPGRRMPRRAGGPSRLSPR